MPWSPRLGLATLLAVALLLVFAATAPAESPGGSISGHVLDPSGHPIPYAVIRIRGTRMLGTTDSNGSYSISRVPAQNYTLDASVDNFYTKRRDVEVRARQALVIDFVLEETVQYNMAMPHVEGSLDTLIATRGQLFLGGTKLLPPYRLYYVNGTLTVNGLQIPRPEEPVIVVSDSMRLMSELIQRVGAMNAVAYNGGQTDSQIVELMRTEYASSSLVESVWTYPSNVVVGFRGGMRFLQSVFRPAPVPRDPVKDPRDRLRDLRELRDTLDKGCLVFIISEGRTTTIPPPWRDTFGSAIEQVKRGEVGQGEATKHLRDPDLIEQLRRPITLLQVP